ncbi:MAG TPA: GGDEF domain-containing protein [Terracidiphilus sp.]|nr:GGDEF domain-containing protein [Terracidiphilus sp.]
MEALDEQLDTQPHTRIDRLTGIYDRETVLAMLFRETDRAQRLHTALSILLFDIDDFDRWNTLLGDEACDQLLWLVAARTMRLLRSYDLLGRTGKHEFLAALPGCGTENAIMLAERLRLDVFRVPFHVVDASIHLSACFGVASSQGRSPVVVLREAEEALRAAKAAGAGSIQTWSGLESTAAVADPACTKL